SKKSARAADTSTFRMSSILFRKALETIANANGCVNTMIAADTSNDFVGEGIPRGDFKPQAVVGDFMIPRSYRALRRHTFGFLLRCRTAKTRTASSSERK